MCGRLNVVDDPLAKVVSEQLGITFQPETNLDLRPSERVSSIIQTGGELAQINLNWGIKPHWSKRLIINAQAETVWEKPTFKSAFETSRVVVPCSGWYEWKSEEGQKSKYLFSSPYEDPIYMAGIALEGNTNLVTLTTKPNNQCQPFHHRMPLLISHPNVKSWLTPNVGDAASLLTLEWNSELLVSVYSN